MSMVLYVLVAISGLIDLVMGVTLVIFGPSHPLLRGITETAATAAPSGTTLLVLFAALACFAAAALHVLLLRWLIQEREEAYPLLQGYGAFALIGGILLFIAFGARGSAWAFLVLDALRGLLLVGLSVIVAVSPNTVRELRLPAGRDSRAEREGSRVGSRVERGRSRVERGGRGRSRSGRDRGRDAGRRREGDAGRSEAREAGGYGTQRQSSAERSRPPGRAPLGRAAAAPAPDEEGRASRATSRRRGERGRGHQRAAEATRAPRSADDTFNQPETSSYRAEMDSERAEAGARVIGEPERRRSSRSRRGGRGRGRSSRAGRAEQRDGEGRGGRPARGEREDRGEGRDRGEDEGDVRREGPRERQAIGGVRPPWMAVAAEADIRDGAAETTEEPGGAIDYSGRRRKKGRYSTGALFRPREKRDRLRQGGRWQAEPRRAWGGTDDEGEASRPDRPAAGEKQPRDRSGEEGAREDA